MAVLSDDEVHVLRSAIHSVVGYLAPRFDNPTANYEEIRARACYAVRSGLYVLGMAHADAVAACVADGMDEGEANDLCQERLRKALVGMMTGKGSE